MDLSVQWKRSPGGRRVGMTLVALWLGAAAVNCGPVDAPAPEAEELSSTEATGEQAQALCLDAPTWPGGYVPVCWDTGTTSADTTMRKRVRDAVENSWGRAANIKFSGWDTCSGSTIGKVIVTLAPLAATHPGYMFASGGSDGVGYNPGGSTVVGLNTTRADFEGTARHHFGHVLGFRNEEQRPGSTTTCAGSGTAVSACGSGPSDGSSIMRHCVSTFGDLSALDVLGARSAYGRKPAGSLVGLGGRCAAVAGGLPALGQDIIMWDCAPQSHFKWDRLSDKQLRAFIPSSPYSVERCMGVAGGTTSATTGTPIISWACDGTPNEQFRFEKVKWISGGNRCMKAYGSYVGSSIMQATEGGCNTTLSDWDFLPNLTIRLHNTNLCVMQEVPGDNWVTLQTCSESNAQKFHFDIDGGMFANSEYDSITARRLRLDSSYPTTSEQTLRVGDDASPPGPNNRFHVSGRIHGVDTSSSSDNQCMTVYGDDYSMGTHVESYSCVAGATPQANQRWDHYPTW